MRTKSSGRIAALRQTQPNALRDIQRDWESWTTGERIVIAMVASSTFALLSLVHWFGTAQQRF